MAEGKWTHDGVPQQLEITEPGSGNALHGLFSETAYRVGHRTADSITLAADVMSEPGYPSNLRRRSAISSGRTAFLSRRA